MARPAHPGQFIKMEVTEPLDLSVTRAAKVLGVTRAALSALIHGRAALSPYMALRIEKAFGPNMDTLLRMQIAYEIAKTRDRGGRDQGKALRSEARCRTRPSHTLNIASTRTLSSVSGEEVRVIRKHPSDERQERSNGHNKK